jgi:hypothetical protein
MNGLAAIRSTPSPRVADVRPVYDMNTSSSVGCVTDTETIGTVSSANKRG